MPCDQRGRNYFRNVRNSKRKTIEGEDVCQWEVKIREYHKLQ